MNSMRRTSTLIGILATATVLAEMPRYTVVPIQSFNLTNGKAIVRGNVSGGTYNTGVNRAFIALPG